MTQRQALAIKTLLPVGAIFAIGVAWSDLRGNINQALPQPRFVAESLRTDATLRAVLDSEKETRDLLRDINARLLEICIAVRSGCR